MYIARALWTNKLGKTYESIWLRESYRQNGKVKTRNLLNLKGWSVDAINILKNSINHCKKTNNLSNNNPFTDASTPLQVDTQKIIIKQGFSVGALFTIYQIAKRLSIIKALGNSPNGKIALWQVCARVLEQGSRLSAARMASFHAASAILQFERDFTENDLYDNLRWLDQNQKSIENKLFTLRYEKTSTPTLFLYDVTSSYLEGKKNELAQFGYNRDKKKGKLQIVIGLLCDNNGIPVSIEVFEGNTQDTKTVLSQIKKVHKRFGCKKVTFVGDRGMLKSTSLEHLQEPDFAYITAITRPQIETLIQSGTLEYGLFDKKLCEVDCDGIRYIFRRNPVRAEEIQATRTSKLNKIKEMLEQKNTYLIEHPQAQVKTALEDIWKKIEKLKVEQWVRISISQAEARSLKLSTDEETLEELKRLDGCYVLKTDVPKEMSGKEEINAHYKDLGMVESAFRTCKTVSLELRPLYVRLSASTRGHVFIVMLAYMIIQELNKLWKEINITTEEGLTHLSAIVETSLLLPGGQILSRIPEPSTQNKALLDAAGIKLPASLKNSKAVVSTYKHNKKCS
jgi:transposase